MIIQHPQTTHMPGLEKSYGVDIGETRHHQVDDGIKIPVSGKCHRLLGNPVKR
jgi:hypothetical protein